MVDYRVYIVDTDGSFCNVVPLDCADDAEAIGQACRLAIIMNIQSFGSLTER